MRNDLRCDRVRELAPELALDVAVGDERAGAMRHLAGCAACRGLVADLSSVGEELLTLAPEHEPPPGFEARVLARLVRPAGRRRRWRAAALVAAGLVLALVVGAGAMLRATSTDRRLADRYRQVLAEGQGSFFAVAPLRDADGVVGTAWGYQGRPSWVFVTAPSASPDDRRFRVSVVTSGGARLDVGTARLGPGHVGWGRELPVQLSSVVELRFRKVGGAGSFTAVFRPGDPWASTR